MVDKFKPVSRYGYHFEVPEGDDFAAKYTYSLNPAEDYDFAKAAKSDRDGRFHLKLPLRGGGYRHYVVTHRPSPNGTIFTFKKAA